MEDKTFYEKLKERVGYESRETIWDNARMIYEQCQGKKYLSMFSTQQAFAEYLGITKGRISQYRYAYEYYLQYPNKIDLNSFSVEQVYTLYRHIGSSIFDFSQWIEMEKEVAWDKISLKELKKLVEEYNNPAKIATNSKVSDNSYSVELTEQENKIIQVYRNGTDKQKALINAIILEIEQG